MTYNIALTNGAPLVTISNGSVDVDHSSLTLVGKNFTGYGKMMNENFVHLLENFSNSQEPENPLVGQLWYDSSAKVIKVRTPDNVWKSIGSAYAGASPPVNPIVGDQWWDTVNSNLKSWTGANWALVGPTSSIFSNSTPPLFPLVGNLWWDTTESTLKSWDGTFWVVVGPIDRMGATGPSGPPGVGFSIAKVYASVGDLQTDVFPTGILPGQFALIETADTDNVENSRLYLYTGNTGGSGSQYTYITDLSGSQGIRGPLGYTGSQGVTGYAGSFGYTGSVGPTGPFASEVPTDITINTVHVGRGPNNKTNNTRLGLTALHSITDGDQNTAVGAISLIKNTSGTGNSAFGFNVLANNITGELNTAIGSNALANNRSGKNNIAIGHNSGKEITTGSNNVIIGSDTGLDVADSNNNIIIADGSGNVRAQCNEIGIWQFSNLTIGTNNSSTWLGLNSLQNNNTAGSVQNTAIGYNALNKNTGSQNTAVGDSSLSSVVAGEKNTAIGQKAGNRSTGSLNTFLGYNSGSNLQTGNAIVILGGYDGNGINSRDGSIVLSDGYGNIRGFCNSDGKWDFSGGLGFTFTISSSRLNVNLREEAISAGWNRVNFLSIVINSNVIIGSASIDMPAAWLSGTYPNGVEIVNYGKIIGKGGDGAAGVAITYNTSGAEISRVPSKLPQNGGTGLEIDTQSVAIRNYNTIAGGGGGGGAGADTGSPAPYYCDGGGGGGGAGHLLGNGGVAGDFIYALPASATKTQSTQGGNGSIDTGGTGGTGGKTIVPILTTSYYYEWGNGGNGGELGQNGQNGANGQYYSIPALTTRVGTMLPVHYGGFTGLAIYLKNNSEVVFENQGTILGPIEIFVISDTISANTSNYNIYDRAVSLGWDQLKPLDMTITIDEGIVVGSTSVTTPGFLTGFRYPRYSTLTLINNGFIVGAGGKGGNASRGAGEAGGTALNVGFSIKITNNGTIGGGGGGGGAGAGGDRGGLGSGGGGGAGFAPGAAGTTPHNGSYNLSNGTVGTLTTGGSGGSPGRVGGIGEDGWGGAGGGGGNLGNRGGNGGNGGSGYGTPGGPGGAAGVAINGNRNVTWITNGIKLGPIV